MPELPEVEVVRQGLSPYILHQQIAEVIIRHQRLRFPIPPGLKELLIGKPILDLVRRGKYLLFSTSGGTLIWHLGMSGSMRILREALPPKKHDHVDLVFANRCCLRFNDPRRFGSLLWTTGNPLEHPLLIDLGPEPLSKDFTSAYLWNEVETAASGTEDNGILPEVSKKMTRKVRSYFHSRNSDARYIFPYQ